LADYLKDRLAWQVYNFDWNGPRPPYVRIGFDVLLDPVRFEPRFESFMRDRHLFFRSNVRVQTVLAAFGAMLVEPHAFDEAYPRGYAASSGFPVGKWLWVRQVRLHHVHVADKSRTVHAMPIEILC